MADSLILSNEINSETPNNVRAVPRLPSPDAKTARAHHLAWCRKLCDLG